jgi:hypothetical protein
MHKKNNFQQMKKLFISIVILICYVNLSHSQQWMTNLDIAQKLALDQNKMVLMVWEGTTKYPYPVLVQDSKGRTLIVEDLFTDETLSPLIWEYFVPVIVSENRYPDLLKEIKGKRNLRYMDKFEDDSIKIMDANGTIINTSSFPEYTDITKLINTYALSTEFIAPELRGYKKEADFYSAYYLASKYLDYSLYTNRQIRSEIIDVSYIYLNEAKTLIEGKNDEESAILRQRAELFEIKKHLILKRPKKALRLLKRMDAETIENNNRPFVAFLYFTAYSITKNREDAAVWRSEMSTVNLRKAQMIINLNN